MSDTQAPKMTHHFGRGGAGNLTTKDPKSPVLPPSSTPTLKAEHYTTGRGGTGNMAKLDPKNPEEARVAQDVDVPGVLLSEGPRSTGRGGAANIYNPTEEEIQAAKLNNEQVRRSSFRNNGLRGVVEKGKELLKGGSKDKSEAVE